MKKLEIIFSIVFILFMILSVVIDYNPGMAMGRNLVTFLIQMIKIIPLTFILIGLFEVWVKRETIEKHMGQESGIRGFFWAILLASTTVGGLYVAFPVAGALKNKGAGNSIIFTYLGAAAICRIPMTAFEINFLGVKFTLIRLIISIPLIIISSIILGRISNTDFSK